MVAQAQPCFTISISSPQLPSIFAGFPAQTIDLTPPLPPLAIPCCKITLPIPNLPIPLPPIPGLNVYILAVNAAIATAVNALNPLLTVPKCPL